MRYRLLLYGYISIIAGILFVLVSPQQALADDKVVVAPESVTCHHPTYIARDFNVGGKIYKACFDEKDSRKQYSVSEIQCPAGSFEEIEGKPEDGNVVRRCVSSAPRCEDGLKEVNGRCVDTKKNREETFSTIIQNNLVSPSITEKAYASFQSNCRGNSECLNTDYDKFLRTYFADQVYLCMQPAATAAEQAKTELGLQGGTAPDEVFANCLKKTYPSINTAALRKQVKEIDFINSLATINQKSASDKITDKPAEDGPQGENAEAERSCGENLEGLGWVICPAMSLGSAAADGAMQVLKQLLNIKPGLLNNTSGTYQAWTYFRNLANVVFVIIFLWVVFSQMTSAGITNYGIKKVLPRLIIGAILVNLSYYIAQAAVDASNILGYSLEQMFKQAAQEIGGSNPGAVHAGLTWVSWAGTTLISTAVVAAVVVLAGGSVLLASLLAIAVVLIILIARQAVVILLVAISPLAFAAWLLPNTEQLFKRWLSLMKGMLVVFPVISLLYGASMLASSVLMRTATENPNGPDWLLQLAALAIVFIPLGATPFVLRGSLNSLGAIGQRLSNLSDRTNRRIGSKVKENSRLGEAWKQHKFNSIQRQARRRAGDSGLARLGRRLASDDSGGRLASLKRGTGRVLSAKGDLTRAIDSSRLGNLIGGTAGAATAASIASKADNEQVEATAILMRSGVDPSELPNIAETRLKKAIEKGDSISARAAQKILLTSGAPGIQSLQTILNATEASGITKDSAVMTSLRQDLNAAGIKDKDAVLSTWAYNNKTIGETLTDADTFSGLTAVELAGQSVKNIEEGVASGGITQASYAEIDRSDAARIKLTDNKRAAFAAAKK